MEKVARLEEEVEYLKQ